MANAILWILTIWFIAAVIVAFAFGRVKKLGERTPARLQPMFAPSPDASIDQPGPRRMAMQHTHAAGLEARVRMAHAEIERTEQ